MIESKIVDPYVESYIKALLPKEEGLLGTLEQYAQEHLVPIVQPEIAQYLKVFTQLVKPKSVLEIGTAIGYSGALFATVMQEGTIDTIELSEDMFAKAEETFDSLKKTVPGVAVTQHLGSAIEVIPTIEKKFDMIFIDAAKGHYKAFFDLCYPLLNEGGVIVSDNVLYKGMIATNLYLVRRKITIVKRMRKYLTFLSTHPELDTTVLPMGDGLAISIKKGGHA
ncbi:O-methyltransferase [Fusibacter bizertensis]|jgi:Predicted O-methyltransferase|uniref:tRNA 5-hydroxyuridine methyltransferase n=1 Tax=Fusibacter bizertensis TaxID=1488331 RepID=A0ABT6N9J9_9FIRM|nr:O-methyltransferase [Fusibacter bizertensis]MDH8677091.1 O-methyltransferase [Fusibacter bizertensis]